jgi:hypothetical protein
VTTPDPVWSRPIPKNLTQLTQYLFFFFLLKINNNKIIDLRTLPPTPPINFVCYSITLKIDTVDTTDTAPPLVLTNLYKRGLDNRLKVL